MLLSNLLNKRTQTPQTFFEFEFKFEFRNFYFSSSSSAKIAEFFEFEFAALLRIKSKFRSQLKTPENNFCCAVANVSPRIYELVAEKQAHPSH